jgi:hypothetical protein
VKHTALSVFALLVSAIACSGGTPESATPPPKSNQVWPPPIDPAAFGTGDLSGVNFAAFSQVGVGQTDPQVLALKPDLVPRAWGQWDTSGVHASDYLTSYPSSCRANGTKFIGGLTASVIFVDQMSDADFQDEVGRDATGMAVPHDEIVPGAYRGALASPGFRQRLIAIAELQIDAGVDGLFFDEVNASYIGSGYDGDEGFDDHDVADFGRFLCAKHGAQPSELAPFDLAPQDQLDCSAADPGAAFDYRGYLARHGAAAAPLSAANPLSDEWGTTVQGRPDPAIGSFVQNYPPLVYWQAIVVAVRKYARETYGKEVFITSNGIFPFTDFQSVGLYEYNIDAPGPLGFDYVPVTGTAPDTHYDGTVSFLPVLQTLADRSQRITASAGGPDVPLLLFLDWPTATINRYYALSVQERQDYVRLFLADAYAYGMWLALPLATTTDSNTATALGMLDFFQQLRSFYEAHAALLHGKTTGETATVSVPGVSTRLVTLADGRRVLHLANHNYQQGFAPQTLTASIPSATMPTSVTLASPDLTQDAAATFSYASGTVTVNIDSLSASMLVVVE